MHIATRLLVVGIPALRVRAVPTRLSGRRADRIRGFKATHEGHSVVICDLGERDLFITFTALFIVFVLILAELAAAVCAKTVKMSAVSECHRVSLTARDRHDFLVVKGLNARRIRLVRLILRVLWQIPNIVQTELSESGLAPGVNVSLSGQRH